MRETGGFCQGIVITIFDIEVFLFGKLYGMNRQGSPEDFLHSHIEKETFFRVEENIGF